MLHMVEVTLYVYSGMIHSPHNSFLDTQLRAAPHWMSPSGLVHDKTLLLLVVYLVSAFVSFKQVSEEYGRDMEICMHTCEHDPHGQRHNEQLCPVIRTSSVGR